MSNKIKIIITIIIFLGASFVNEAKSQKEIFEIPLNEEKIAEIKKINKKVFQKIPQIKNYKFQKIKTDEKEIAEIEKNNLINNGFKTDFYEIYKKAAEKYNLDWRIIAAIHKIETGQSGNTKRKSYAGAQGPMQFMPKTFKSYAVDGNEDGIKNINDVYDAIFTAANYLYQNKGSENIENALFRYNHSLKYVNKVKSLAYRI